MTIEKCLEVGLHFQSKTKINDLEKAIHNACIMPGLLQIFLTINFILTQS